MLSDRSSAPTLLRYRPSARKSLGRSQKIFKLLTKSIFCSLHHDNNRSFKLKQTVVSRHRNEGHLGRSRPGCTGPVQRNTRSRGCGSVSSALHTYPGLVSIRSGCFQHCSPLPQLGLLPQQLSDQLLHGLQLQLHIMQLKCVLTCTQR